MMGMVTTHPFRGIAIQGLKGELGESIKFGRDLPRSYGWSCRHFRALLLGIKKKDKNHLEDAQNIDTHEANFLHHVVVLKKPVDIKLFLAKC